MNRFVESWNRQQSRPKYVGPDAVSIEGEKVVLGSTALESEVKKMGHPDRKVVINEGAVKDLALHGGQDRVESLYRETHRTLVRLGLDPKAKVRAFSRQKRFTGGRPSVHDVVRWLDDIENNDKYVEDVKYLKHLHATCRGRAHQDVIDAVEKVK
jgi:hypothetical protein